MRGTRTRSAGGEVFLRPHLESQPWAPPLAGRDLQPDHAWRAIEAAGALREGVSWLGAPGRLKADQVVEQLPPPAHPALAARAARGSASRDGGGGAMALPLPRTGVCRPATHGVAHREAGHYWWVPGSCDLHAGQTLAACRSDGFKAKRASTRRGPVCRRPRCGPWPKPARSRATLARPSHSAEVSASRGPGRS